MCTHTRLDVLLVLLCTPQYQYLWHCKHCRDCKLVRRELCARLPARTRGPTELVHALRDVVCQATSSASPSAAAFARGEVRSSGCKPCSRDMHSHY